MTEQNPKLDSGGFPEVDGGDATDESQSFDQTRIVRMRPLSGAILAAPVSDEELAASGQDRGVRPRRQLGSDTVEFGFEPPVSYAAMRGDTNQQPAIQAPRNDTRNNPALNSLAARLGHRFQNPVLLLEALTDASVDASERQGSADNWRLAFVGIRTVGLVLSEMLMHVKRNRAWTDLEAAMSDLTQSGSLAAVAREVGLGSELHVSTQGVAQGRREDRMALATALAATVGAVFFDGGYSAARQLVVRLYASRVEALTARLRANSAAVPMAHGQVTMTPCVQLSALAKQQGSGPMYSAALEVQTDAGRRLQVTVALQLNGKSWRATGEGSDAGGAENDAARRLLAQLARG